MLLAPGTRARSAEIEWIHAAANEGLSAGGHSALRVDDTVYHYLVRDDRLLRLARHSWTSFRTNYNSLENRNLDLASISLEEVDRNRIRDRFERIRVVQQAHFDRLERAAFERAWADASHQAQRDGEATAQVRLAGAGLFDREALLDPSTRVRRLKSAIERERGSAFLSKIRESLDLDLQSTWHASEITEDPDWEADQLPGRGFATADELRELLWMREALDGIENGWPLIDARLLDPVGVSGSGLTAAERGFLKTAAAELESRVLELVASRQPARGRVLLVAIARHRAISRSLEEDRLWTLDPFPVDAPRISTTDGASQRVATRELAEAARHSYESARANLVNDFTAVERQAAFSSVERALHSLEVAAARHSDLQRAIREGASVRRVEPPFIPLPVGTVDAPLLPVSEYVRARENEVRIRDILETHYGYDLIRHNCATELVRTTRDAFPDGAAARRVLGDDLDPGGTAFVPVGLQRRVVETLRVERAWRIPSYRARAIERMRGEENDFLVWLREANTLSSRVYLDNPRDSAFLFFTDGRAWSRPLLGVANFAYGTAHATAGLFTWPFDRGSRLRRGLAGALYSVPELGFVNIRKGRFDYNEDLAELIATTP